MDDKRYLDAEKADIKHHLEVVLGAFTLRTGWVIDGIGLRTEIAGERVRYHVQFTGTAKSEIDQPPPDPRRTRPL